MKQYSNGDDSFGVSGLLRYARKKNNVKKEEIN